MNESRIEQLIRECQAEAEKSIQSGDPPFGCIITDSVGNLATKAHNSQNSDRDATAHAEIKALRQLCQKLGSRYLDGYVMFSNASSCSMCMSGSVKAHIRKFYYGAPPEDKMDPWLTMEEIAQKCQTPVQVYGPVLGDECAAQITNARDKPRN